MKKHSLAIDGKVYISSSRASEIAGYSKDYVGQLCRSGKLVCRTIGRSWYIDEASLRRHQSETTKANQTSIGPGGLIPTPLPQAARLSAGPFSVPVGVPERFSSAASNETPGPAVKSLSYRVTSVAAAVLLILSAIGISTNAFLKYIPRVASPISSADNSANAISGAYGGLVVVPSQGSTTDAKLAQSIINSFSDTVTVTPSKNGTVGVITPEFRSVKGHDFLYVLVPVKATSTVVQDDSR